MKLSVVIPCYNERSTIEAVVEAVRSAPVEDVEIIVVDDGSTDVTRELLKGKPLGWVDKIVLQECNLGTSLDEKLYHYRRYTKTTLRRLVEQEGLAVEQVRYADCVGFIASLVFRLLNRSASTLAAPTISFYDRWLFPPSRVLDGLFGRWFGKNVYVLCRKRLSLLAS